MNRPPEILVDTGFEVDQNGAFKGITFPQNVLTLSSAPTSITTYAETIGWLPNTGSTLTVFNAPNLVSVTKDRFFQQMSVRDIHFPKATYLNIYPFYRNVHIVNVTLESYTVIPTESFEQCTSLQNITFGSEGNPVTSISSDAFKYTTQADLTITIYTTGGASLANEPWGATNATIEYEEA